MEHPDLFITTVLLVLQALTLAVQFVMTALMVTFRKQNIKISTEPPVTSRVIESNNKPRDGTTLPSNPSVAETPSKLRKYGLAVLFVPAALIVSLLVRRALHISHPLAWFLAAVIVSAWYGGPGAGLITMILSVPTIAYFILPPLYSFAVTPPEMWYIIGFVLWGFLSIWFGSRRRGAEEALKQLALAWKQRWQRSAQLIEQNAQLLREIAELRERVATLEKEVRQRGSAAAGISGF